MAIRKKIITSLALSVLTILLVFILVNQFDEDLDPELKVILDKKQTPPPETENAFYAYTGFYAPEGVDIVQAGKKLLDEYEHTPITDRTSFFSNDEQFDGKRLTVVDDKIRICRIPTERNSCLKMIRSKKDTIAQNLNKNRVLITRYKSLYQYSHFYSNSSYLPETPFSVHNLVLKEIAIDWVEGRRQQALDTLISDIRFHRMVARESQTLLSKLVALAGMSYSYRMLQEFINECVVCAKKDSRINAVLADLDDETILSHRIMEGEIRWVYATHIKAMDSVKTRYDYFNMALGSNSLGEKSASKFYGVLGYLMEYNATMNDNFVRLFKPNLLLSQYKYKGFEEREKLTREIFNNKSYKWYEYFYNPAGKYLNQQGIPILGYAQYFKVPFKVGAQIRLTRLQLLIKQKRLSTETISDFLKKQPTENLDPYTGASVRYDQQNKSLYVYPFNRKDDVELVYL